MSYASLDDLRAQLGGQKTPAMDEAYRAKQIHALPERKVVDRVEFILVHTKGKRVLEFGASGELSTAIRETAKSYWGVDRVGNGWDVVGFDLDDVTCPELPVWEPEIIICGEVLEHLGNPLWFLTRLHRQYAGVPTILTVPNAYNAGSLSWLAKGYENVNQEHVAWYSPKTLSVLLERAGYTVGELFYYNGNGPTAEGLVVVTE